MPPATLTCVNRRRLDARAEVRFHDVELRRLEAIPELEPGEPVAAVETRPWQAIELARRRSPRTFLRPV